MPCTLGIFPHITQQEFEIACEKLIAAFRKCGPDEEKWSTVEIIHDFTSNYLRITTRPPFDTDNNQSATGIAETEINEQDDEAVSLCKSPIIMQYDTVLSPVYQVPVLYIDVVDPMHRFPPTMDTLYKYIIPEHYKSQAEHVGVIGGITIQVRPSPPDDY